MENNVKQEVNRCIKDILYYAYKNDVVFPRSCGLVSTLLTYSLKDTSLSSNYDIFLIRGIFKNINNRDNIQSYFNYNIVPINTENGK